MIGTTTIVTATYNKEKYFEDAIESVLSQTRPNWRWWIIMDGANAATSQICLRLAHRDSRVTLFKEDVVFTQRYDFYRPSMLMNKYFPLIATDYFCWLSDDDILEPNYLEILAGALDRNRSWDIVYGACEVLGEDGDSWRKTYSFPLDPSVVYDVCDLPCGHIDGGSIVQTKRSYDRIKEWQFPTKGNHRLSDGLYMNELARHFKFHPVECKVLTHRQTAISENTKSSL